MLIFLGLELLRLRLSHVSLTLILLSWAYFATPPRQELGIRACHLGTLGLDVLALNSANDPPFLVYLLMAKLCKTLGLIKIKNGLTGTHSQWTQYMTPKGEPRSGCQVCSSS